jgi:hypothetical protein
MTRIETETEKQFNEKVLEVNNLHRNEVLEEVAKEFDAMKSLGDTAASFAAFVRGMKR